MHQPEVLTCCIVFCFADRAHAEQFRQRSGGELLDPKDRRSGRVWGDCDPRNRYAREHGFSRTLVQLVESKKALVAISRCYKTPERVL